MIRCSQRWSGDRLLKLRNAKMSTRTTPKSHLSLSTTMLRAAPDAAIIIDTHGIIFDANAKAELLFGYSLDEMRDCNVNMLMPEPFASQHDSYLKKYLETPFILGTGRELRAKDKQGRIVDIYLTLSEIRNEDTHHFCGFIKDLRSTEFEMTNSESRSRKEVVSSEDAERIGVADVTLSSETIDTDTDSESEIIIGSIGTLDNAMNDSTVLSADGTSSASAHDCVAPSLSPTLETHTSLTEASSLRRVRRLSASLSASFSADSASDSPCFTEIDYNELEFLSDKPIGKGAFGVVYAATWRGAKVAVKRLLSTFLDAEQLMMFRQEAALMQHVANHPNVVKFVGACLQYDKYAIVTKYCKLGSVYDELIKRQAKWPLRRLLRVLRDASSGVSHLHKEHIIHRDIAARNFLLDQNYHVYVTDFGLARICIQLAARACANSSLGPVRHMAPEAIKEKKYSEKSDSFSFGTFIWECTHRDEPFKEMEVFEVAKGVVDGSLRPLIDPTRMHPQLMIDNVLPTLMTQCWRADEGARPSMNDISEQLTSYYQTNKETS